MRSKVFAIPGEITQLGFALSQQDRQHLMDNVTVVFHAAASVKFDDELREAVRTNLRSAREVVKLAKEMKHLKVRYFYDYRCLLEPGNLLRRPSSLC